jgi:hypothetical protein
MDVQSLIKTVMEFQMHWINVLIKLAQRPIKAALGLTAMEMA